MIKRIKLYIALAAVILSTASCLDKYPDNAIPEKKAMTTVEHADQVVIGIYAAFKSPALYSGYLTLLPDLQTDLAYAVNGFTNVYGDLWRWDILSTNAEIEAVYAQLYSIIGQCNFFFDYIDQVEAGTTDDQKLYKLEGYKGEVHFARALAYSELIKLYCKAYNPATADKELGVPLVTSYVNPERAKRSSLKASYQFVLDDLAKAAIYLNMDEDNAEPLYNSGGFTIGTVHSLYARVYLYMQDWSKAIEHASEVINSDYYMLSSVNTVVSGTKINAYDYMWQYDSSTEIIWRINFETSSYGGKLGQIFFNFDYQSYKPDYVPAKWVFALYDQKDLRYEAFFSNATTGYSHGLTWPLLLKYYGNRTFMQSRILHVNMPKPFRLGEQYLIRAEAYAQKGEYSNAGRDISKLRIARYKTYGGSTPITKDNWLNIIGEERVKELYMEGFRLTDLKRWNKGFERTPQTNTVSPGNALKIDASNPLFVWPIPQHELQLPDADIEPNESNK